MLLMIENHWVKMKHQIQFLNSVWDSLDADLQVHQLAVLRVLQGKLQAAILIVDGLHGDAKEDSSIKQLMRKKGDVKRVKYAILVKESLRKAVEELKEWSSMFDPSWFLIISVRNQRIDERLTEQSSIHSGPLSELKCLRDAMKTDESLDSTNKPMFISLNDMEFKRTPIKFSSSQVARKEHEAGSTYIVDTMSLHPQANVQATTKDVRHLARTLSTMIPLTFGLLRCQGVIKNLPPASNSLKAPPKPGSTSPLYGFEFVFALPQGLGTPQSLRGLLLSPIQEHPLNERFEVAKQLANSVMFVHNAQFVHKNISPETILLLRSESSVLGMPFLVGFEKFRLADGKTYHIGDSKWQQNLYRYPTRQGMRPGEDYRMQHDIYSLGVCLLEIGLWSSFVRYDSGDQYPRPCPELAMAMDSQEKHFRTKPFDVKRTLIDLARRRLPSQMGQRYAEIVESCLTCLDKTNPDFGNEKEFMDEDGVLVWPL
ncbi:hypothetical protein ABVK25_001910 [Lepraria finkii]|uniref:Protein kinase domain-containing protein n=1 Tax=Lepraria finkii TaxID=1340010 RepID=A0ABR4BL11_9LECA